jgi:hypothetical protein
MKQVQRPAKTFPFRGTRMTARKIADCTGISLAVVRRRLQEGTPVDAPLSKGGRTAKPYLFRGAWMTVPEIAALTGLSDVTIYHRRSGNRILEGDELQDPQQDHADRARRITCAGKTLTLRGWAKITGIPASILRNRLNHGWPITRALTEGVMPMQDRHKRRATLWRLVRAFRATRNRPVIMRMVQGFRCQGQGYSMGTMA